MKWVNAPLGEVTTIISGTTPQSSNPDHWGGTNVWVTPTDLGNLDKGVITSSARRITDIGVRSCNLSRIPAGAVVMSSRAPIGYLAIAGCDMYTNQGCKSFVCSDAIDPEFLFLTLQHRMPEIQALGSGATFVEVSKSTLEAFEISFPEIGQQHRIAARLKDQLAEVEKARQAAELQLMETVKLTDAVNKTLENEIFANAEIQLFGSYVKSYRNGFGKRPKEGETGNIVLRIADVSNGIISTANPRYGEISAKEAETYKLKVGDLIFIRVNGSKEIVGRCCVVNTNVPDGTIFNDHLIRVQIMKELDPDFARLCVSLPKARKIIEEAASTSAGQLTINQQLLDRLEIPIYSVDNQKKIVEKLQKQLNQLSVLREAALNCITDINVLPQKILARAFGG